MSGPTIMMQLGPVQFGISTAAYQQLSRTAEYKWAEQERFGQNPALQFVGTNAESISIDGVFYPAFSGSIDQIQTWRDYASIGVPLTLVAGRGIILGEWVITSIQEKQSVFADAGAALKNDFTIEIKFYDFPAYSDAQMTAASSVNTTTLPDAVSAGGLASSASSAMSSISDTMSGAIAQINAAASSATMSLAPALAAASSAMTIANTVKNSALAAQNIIKSGLKINSIASAKTALGTLQSTCSNAANAGAGAAGLLKSIGAQFSAGGQPAAAISAIKSAMLGANQLTMSSATISDQSSNLIDSFPS